MSQSIISNEYECIICGKTEHLHRHHIYFGRDNRAISEREGCWCYLCPRHHNTSGYGVHYNHKLDQKLKRQCERRWLELHNATIEDFIKVFGRNYLDEQ